MKFALFNRAERQRLWQIISILRSHGFKDGFSTIKNPAEVRKTLEVLGPTFVKVGQILSLRPDLLPESFIEEFSKLQDDVIPEPYGVVEKMLTTALGHPMEEVFQYFDPNPIACASIAVVHKAILKNGNVVAVKIQRSNVKERFFVDLAIFRKLSPLTKPFLRGASVDPYAFTDEICKMLENEIDFNNEATSMQRFYEANFDNPDVTSPKPYMPLCTDKIIVMEFIEGLTLSQLEKSGESKDIIEKYAHMIATSYMGQIFEDAFCHADPHPGNILITNGKIAFLDFGLAVEIKKSLRLHINNLIIAIGTGDTESLTQTLMSICDCKPDIDFFDLHADISFLYNKYINNASQDIDIFEYIKETLELSKKYRMTIPRDVAILLKGLSTLLGTILKYAPNLNAKEIFEPYVKARMKESFNLSKDSHEQLMTLYNIYRYGMKIPGKTYELMNHMVAGRIRFGVVHHNLERFTAAIQNAGNRLSLAILTTASILGSTGLLTSDLAQNNRAIYDYAMSGLGASVLLGMLLLILIFKRPRM